MLLLLFQGECVVLRDRKLNIAPAIKKQVNFNSLLKPRGFLFIIFNFWIWLQFFLSLYISNCRFVFGRALKNQIGRCCDKWCRLLCTNPTSSTQQYSDWSIFSCCCCSWSISAGCSSSNIPPNHTIPTILSILQCTNGKPIIFSLLCAHQFFFLNKKNPNREWNQWFEMIIDFRLMKNKCWFKFRHTCRIVKQ